MQKLFDTVRRATQAAFAHKHEFVIAVLTFAADHRLAVGIGFAVLLGGWFVASAIFEGRRHSARKTRKRIVAEWRWLLVVCQAGLTSLLAPTYKPPQTGGASSDVQ